MSEEAGIKLIELTSLQVAELALLNETAPTPNQVTPVRQEDGHVIAADLLDDCGPGQTFEHFGNFLRGLSREEREKREAEVPPSPAPETSRDPIPAPRRKRKPSGVEPDNSNDQNTNQ